MKNKAQLIELLAPARDAEIAIEAIKHGADAVYMGPAGFGARQAAGNSTADVARVCAFAHQFNARVYATVNTVVLDNELARVERLIHDLYHAGVDALIVQDLGILRLDLPPIALHASTQCDLRTPAKAQFLASLGFSQLVLARELSLLEIAQIHQAVPEVPLEAFCHGALCVSYSGRCQVSQVLRGRSANRGACAQMCRLAYDLTDGEGRTLLHNKHLLSLRDFNASSHLLAMLQAGVTSFKIEGRLKDAAYVKNVTAYYRQRIDQLLAAHPELGRRSSAGTSTFSFTPDVARSFNRSFTSYFLDGRPANGSRMASLNTPKSMGEPLGTVLHSKGKTLVIDSSKAIANGDGLSFMGNDGQWTGVRVNRAQGNRVELRQAVSIPVGTAVHRTSDKAFDDVLSRPSATRAIAVDATLRYTSQQLVLTLSDERGNQVTCSLTCPPLQAALSSQTKRQLSVLGKLGGTIYVLRHAEVCGQWFIPASVLTSLRRKAIGLLDHAQLLTRERPTRLPEKPDSPCFATTLTSADNVANHLAATLYHDHGVTAIEPAIELSNTLPKSPVMHTRYCLRRELGACRKQPGSKKLPSKLLLRHGDDLLRVECDCTRCEMNLYVEKKQALKQQ